MASDRHALASILPQTPKQYIFVTLKFDSSIGQSRNVRFIFNMIVIIYPGPLWVSKGYWQRCYMALQQRASAKFCGVVQGTELRNFRRGRHLYSTGRPSRWASIGPHSSFSYRMCIVFSAPAWLRVILLNLHQHHWYKKTS